MPHYPNTASRNRIVTDSLCFMQITRYFNIHQFIIYSVGLRTPWLKSVSIVTLLSAHLLFETNLFIVAVITQSTRSLGLNFLLFKVHLKFKFRIYLIKFKYLRITKLFEN